MISFSFRSAHMPPPPPLPSSQQEGKALNANYRVVVAEGEGEGVIEAARSVHRSTSVLLLLQGKEIVIKAPAGRRWRRRRERRRRRREGAREKSRFEVVLSPSMAFVKEAVHNKSYMYVILLTILL